jgi:raffinose/stachyose/melibiose transport system substrate-binding protein
MTTQLELTELAAGNGPDLMSVIPGRNASGSVYELARLGYLAPLVNEPWTKGSRSMPVVTSLSKVGPALYEYVLSVTPFGLFTNDALFAKLGLKVPQTFAQLLDVCRKAKADGTVAVAMSGANATSVSFLLVDLAASTVYAADSHWTADLRAGKTTFEGTPGWHEALQEFVDMSSAGCFQPGMATASSTDMDTAFAEGQALTESSVSTHAGTIDQVGTQVSYSFHPFPGGTTPATTTTAVFLSTALSINAHASLQNQAAAREFIDFLARPEQNALYDKLTGRVTQYQFLNKQLPAFAAPLLQVIRDGNYDVDPNGTWWNPQVSAVLQTDQIGLVTGQSTVDGTLQAMDAAWQQGPS